LFNKQVERHTPSKIDLNIVLGTSNGELRETCTIESDPPRIEGKVPYIDDDVQSSKMVQPCSKTRIEQVQKDKIEHFEHKKSFSREFNRFWEAYPRRQAKKKTYEIWRRKKLDNLIDIILEDLQQRDDWNAGSKFTPLPTTYLNGDRWEDEEKNERKKESNPNKSPAELLIEKYNKKEEIEKNET